MFAASFPFPRQPGGPRARGGFAAGLMYNMGLQLKEAPGREAAGAVRTQKHSENECLR